MSTPCFWVEPTGEAEASLRRWSRSEGGCPVVPPGWKAARGYHDASAPLGRVPIEFHPDGTHGPVPDDSVPHGDPRWPAACACGYAFSDGDEWRCGQDPVYRAADGREWPSRSLPPGAMLDARWMPDAWKGPDGMAVTVVLPKGAYVDGETDTRGWWWNVDGPSNDGNGNLKPHAWSRTGDPRASPPTVSATPSIDAAGQYHGFLTGGVLTDSL